MASFKGKGVGLYKIKMNPLPSFEVKRWVHRGSSDCKVSFGSMSIGILENSSFTTQPI